jgi:hypothetical protein
MIDKAFILIAPYFDEASVVHCLCQMREEGIWIRLVGLIPGPLGGQRGLTLIPDLSLSELEKNDLLRKDRPLLIIPGGAENASLLFSDPRVHQLCETAVQSDGWLALLRPAQRVLAASGIFNSHTSDRLIEQNNMGLTKFIEHLTRCLKTGYEADPVTDMNCLPGET